MAYYDDLTDEARVLNHPDVAIHWHCEPHEGPHTIECLWVWHYCREVLGANTVAAGQWFGWRPSGARLHALVSVEPLTLDPSVYWSECCGLHGWIREGRWVQA